MRISPYARRVILLIAVAAIAAMTQLLYSGFTPPLAVPFGVAMEDIKKLPKPIVWIDARPEEMFQVAHIPGALNLNRTNWEEALPRLFEAYRPGNPIIVYCSPDCSESEEIASRIRNLGFDPALVLEGGFQSWQDHNRDL